jgi:hypothetical protein
VSESRVDLLVKGVNVLSTNVNISLRKTQVGLWARSRSKVEFENFNVDSDIPKAFVVMQFSKPYNELYEEVVSRVCDEFGIGSVRADEIYGPGMIIADIVRKIEECKVVIEDITPDNPNVYYEIGYSHAINKPTILISEEGRNLPFDVSPFRVLFYENTIAGKKKVEEGLREHLSTILDGTT